MKHLHKSLAALFLTIVLFSCSKKVQTFHFGQPYYNQNSTANSTIPQPEEAVKTEEQPMTVSTEKAQSMLLPEAVTVAKSINEKPATTVINKENKPTEKLTFKQKVAQKIIGKKLEKQMGKSGVSGNLRTGIIIAAIGLLLLIIAGVGGFGGASGVFWVLGAVALVIGLVIVLLEVI